MLTYRETTDLPTPRPEPTVFSLEFLRRCASPLEEKRFVDD